MVMKAVTTPAAPTVLMLAEMVPYRTFRVVETLVPPPFSVRVRTSSPFSTMDGLELSTACVCVCVRRAGGVSFPPSGFPSPGVSQVQSSRTHECRG